VKLTKTPALQHLSRTSACMTSFIVVGPELESTADWDPACLAICRRFRLLSNPTIGDEGPGSDRYFPFPVPESNPMFPGGIELKNFAMMGQGFCWVSLSVSREGAQIPCILWRRNVKRFVRKSRGRARFRALGGWFQVGYRWR